MVLFELVSKCSVTSSSLITDLIMKLALSSILSVPYPEFLLKNVSTYEIAKTGQGFNDVSDIDGESVEYLAPSQFYDIPPIKVDSSFKASKELVRLEKTTLDSNLLVGLLQVPASMAKDYGVEPSKFFNSCKSVAVVSDFFLVNREKFDNPIDLLIQLRLYGSGREATNFERSWAAYILALPVKPEEKLKFQESEPDVEIFVDLKPFISPKKL